MSNSSRVAVVIVTYNSAEVLSGCVAALPAAMAGIDDWELVVADNASTDATADRVRELAPDAKLVQLSANRGYAAGINVGVAATAVGSAVLVLNPDTRPQPASILCLLEAVKIPGVGIAVPKILDEDGRLEYSLRRAPSLSRVWGEALLGGHRGGRFRALGEVVSQPGAYSGTTAADWATGAAMLISADCVQAAGQWDESFFLYSEETEFALRASDCGFTLRYVPEAEVVHLGGEALVSPRLWTILVINRLRLYRRRRGRLASALFAVALATNEALRWPKSATHRAALRALFSPSHRPPELRESNNWPPPAPPG